MKRTKSRAWYQAVEKELQAQAQQRARIAEAERKLNWWRAKGVTVLQRGGKGWVNEAGHAEMMVEKWWNELRRLVVIFNRRPLPELP